MMEGFSGTGAYIASDKYPSPNNGLSTQDYKGLCKARLKKQGHLILYWYAVEQGENETLAQILIIGRHQ